MSDAAEATDDVIDVEALMTSVEKTIADAEAAGAMAIASNMRAIGSTINPRLAALHAAGFLVSVGVPVSMVGRIESVALEIAGGVSDAIAGARDGEGL